MACGLTPAALVAVALAIAGPMGGCGVTGPSEAMITVTATAVPIPQPIPRGMCASPIPGNPEYCTYFVFVRLDLAEHAGVGAQVDFLELEVNNVVSGQTEASLCYLEMFANSPFCFGTSFLSSVFGSNHLPAPRDARRLAGFRTLSIHAQVQYTWEVGAGWEQRDVMITVHLTDDGGNVHRPRVVVADVF
jgi:hypothetical protein